MSKLKIPKLAFGVDNGAISLYDISLKEYKNYRTLIDRAYDNDELADSLEKDLTSHEIEVGYSEFGYIDSTMMYLSKVFGFDVESN